MLLRTYCVGKVQNVQLASIMIMVAHCLGKVHTMIPSIMIMGAYCLGKVHNMLPR